MNLDAFFATLDRAGGPVPLASLAASLEALDLDPAAIREHVVFSPASYRRNRLRIGGDYEALILCWRPGQASPIHDHSGSACGVRVLMGAATETPFHRGPGGRLVPESPRRLPAGAVCVSEDADIHEIANRGETDLVTLHVYTPPLTRYRVFAPSGEARFINAAAHDTATMPV